MIIAWLAILVCIAGALIYAFASNAKVAEIGRLMFACGLLVALFAAGGKTTVRIL